MAEPKLLGEMIEVVREAGKVGPHLVVAPDKRLIDDLGIDSLDLVGVLLQIQDRYDVVIEDEDVPSLIRVADLANYVQRHRDPRAA